ncbi:MAG: hypothetical protein ACYDGM_14670, partial [Vulcanimicrobiaceae bacterium]
MMNPMRGSVVTLALAAAVSLNACGGGGSSPVSQPTTSPLATPTPVPPGTQAFHIVIESTGVRGIALAPSGVPLVLPTGFQAG